MKQRNEDQDLLSKITSNTVFFFDMDGTLVDTNLANFLSYKEAIKTVTKINHDLKFNALKRFNRRSLKMAVPNLKESAYKRIIQEKETNFKDFLHETKLIPEIVNILIKYSKTHKTVLVTNCRKDRANLILKYYGLEDRFSNIFYRKFDSSGKKINKFLNAIIQLGVEPNLVIAFENEEIEIIDAKKAGISIINPIFVKKC